MYLQFKFFYCHHTVNRIPWLPVPLSWCSWWYCKLYCTPTISRCCTQYSISIMWYPLCCDDQHQWNMLHLALFSPYLLFNISMEPQSNAEISILVLLLAVIPWIYNWHVSLYRYMYMTVTQVPALLLVSSTSYTYFPTKCQMGLLKLHCAWSKWEIIYFIL